PDLLQLLSKKDLDIDTKLIAIRLLGLIGPEAKAAMPALIAALSDENFHAQYWACRSLAKWEAAAEPAAALLIEKLKKGNPSVRRHAALALGAIGPAIGREGVDGLLAATGDQLHPVRADAIRALGKLGEIAKPAVPQLRVYMNDPKYNVRT